MKGSRSACLGADDRNADHDRERRADLLRPARLGAKLSAAIAEFRGIVSTETSIGHVAHSKQSNAMAELARIEQACRAGRSAEALATLHPLQRRMGFR